MPLGIFVVPLSYFLLLLEHKAKKSFKMNIFDRGRRRSIFASQRYSEARAAAVSSLQRYCTTHSRRRRRRRRRTAERARL